jgi:hypothetical protein
VRYGLLAVVGALTLAASGCGSGGSHCVRPDGMRPLQRDGGQPTRYLTGVSVATTACVDRIEFAFEHGVPGYRLAYASAAQAQTEDASGRHIPVAGAVFLVVRLSPAATARSDGSTLTRTYDGPRRLPAGDARHVREVVKTGDFEAVVTWAVGLDEMRPFSVSVSADTLAVEIG